MCVSSPKMPAPPPLPEPPPPPPTPLDPAVKNARTRNRQAAVLAASRNNNVFTTALGLQTQAAGARKTLLGM